MLGGELEEQLKGNPGGEWEQGWEEGQEEGDGKKDRKGGREPEEKALGEVDGGEQQGD